MRTRNTLVAWVLILLGVLLLIDRIGIVSLGAGKVLWSVLLVFGGALVIQSVLRPQRWKLFWGSVLFLYSLYFLLRHFDLVRHESRTFLPATFLIFGFAFLMIYVYEPREIARLVLSILFLLTGGVWIAASIGLADLASLVQIAAIYWPVVLILLGLALLLGRSRERGNAT
ncbi:MAG: LiaF transmembrane domain-containing protein [Bacteroidota bacterium]